MRYLVFGTGAVGALVGGRLALSGNPVTFLARPRVADALERQGLRLGGDGPPRVVPQPTVVHELDAAFRGPTPPEVILLAVKSYDCQAAAESLAAISPHSPPVMCLLNGIGNEATLASYLGPDRVIAAALTTAVLMPEPGVVRVERERGLDLAATHPLSPRLARDFAKTGMRIQLHSNPDQMKWSKLLTNIVANATSAIMGWTPRAVFRHPDLYRLELEALREVVRVMRCLGLTPENLVGVRVGMLAWALRLPPWISQPFLTRAVASGRGSKRPSFNFDIGRGRSEVGWLNGAVAREGTRQGLPTPANAVLTRVMQELVDAKLDPSQVNDKPQALLARAQREGVPGIQGYNRLAPGAQEAGPRSREEPSESRNT